MTNGEKYAKKIKWFPVLALQTVVAFLISFLIPFIMNLSLFLQIKNSKKYKMVSFDNYLGFTNEGLINAGLR